MAKHYTLEEELKLLKGFKNKDQESMEKLAVEATRLALAIAERYTNRESSKYPSLVSYAVSGFYKAINPYLGNEREKEHKFTPYALFFMKQEIERHLNN
jgi:DNA-directed RNA polymerase specialized sigma subunit